MHTKIANVNIEGENKVFHYIVEYCPQYAKTSNFARYIVNNRMNDFDDDNDIIFINDSDPDYISDYVKHYNNWVRLNELGSNYTTIHGPRSEYKLSKVTLYLPAHSVDTYERGVKYSITLNTWVCGKKVILGSYIFSRHNAVACNRPKRFMNMNYYECVEFTIIDPYDLVYNDNWTDWRRVYCNESTPKNGSIYAKGVNSVGSILCVNVHPIIEEDSGYIKTPKYVGGQNSININTSIDDFLNLDLYSNINDKSIDEPSFVCKLKFNPVYNGNLNEYLHETYDCESEKDRNYKLKYNLVIGNEDNIYGIYESEVISLQGAYNVDHYNFNKRVINKNNFDSWDGYKEGIYVVSSVDILDQDNESVISLLSNRLPLTQKLYSFFIKKDFTYDLVVNGRQKRKITTHSINIDDVDMKLYNINAVNKITTNIIQTQKSDDAKNNIIQPIFFRVVESSDILIHPSVTENICINLDRYKSKVDSFMIRVEGVNFYEIGRNSSGVIFKIKGNYLPNSSKNGSYYILDQDGEMVTSGKYNYSV